MASAFSYTRVRSRPTARHGNDAQADAMTPPSRPANRFPPVMSENPGLGPSRLDGEDSLGWARRVWDDRETWLGARGGVESVFVAAQILGCREDAVRWLRCRTRF